MELGEGPEVYPAPFSMYNDYEASWEATESMRRYSFVTSVPVCGAALGGILAFLSLASIAPPADDQSILPADREFVQAAPKRYAAALGKVLAAALTRTGPE